MKSLIVLIVLVILFFSFKTNKANANGLDLSLGASPSNKVLQKVLEHNQQLNFNNLSNPDFLNAPSHHFPFLNERELKITAFSEWENTGYLVFSDENRYGSKRMKKELVEGLPKNVKLIVYTQNHRDSHHKNLFNYYSNMLSPERVIILKLPKNGKTSLWTRDNTPIPVRDQNNKPYLVDAKYYYNFEPDASFSRMYQIELLTNPYFFEGGNLTNNSLGDCIIINRRVWNPLGTSDTAAIPDEVFKRNYGCTNIIRFKHLKGIGHVDEVVKFLDDNTIVTDTEAYIERLEAQGFDVHLLPEPKTPYGTYINSLIINNVIYIPVFKKPSDKKALEIYRKILPNHTIIPIESSILASYDQGGIHCITMTYPPYELMDLSEALNGTIAR